MANLSRTRVVSHNTMISVVSHTRASKYISLSPPRLLLSCPAESKHLTKRDIQLFWRSHATTRLLPAWDTINFVDPPPELKGQFATCVSMAIQGHTVRHLRDHLRDYFVGKNMIVHSRAQGRTRLSRIPDSSWSDIFRTFEISQTTLPCRINTAVELRSFYHEVKIKWSVI